MPLTAKGRKIRGAMKREYGSEKGEQVFYASKNKGRIKGVDGARFRQTIGDALAHGLSISDALAEGVRAAETKDARVERRKSFFRGVRDAAASGMSAADAIAGALGNRGPFGEARFAKDYGVPGMKKGYNVHGPEHASIRQPTIYAANAHGEAARRADQQKRRMASQPAGHVSPSGKIYAANEHGAAARRADEAKRRRGF